MEIKDRYIEVVLPVPVDHSFVYTLAGTTPAVGQRVLVPFGTRRLVGVIKAVDVRRPDYETRPAIEVIDREPCLSEPLVRLLAWASGYYCHPIGDVFKQFLPHRGIRLEADRSYKLVPHVAAPQALDGREAGMVDYLRHRKPVSRVTLVRRFGLGTINKLVKAGVVEAVFKPIAGPGGIGPADIPEQYRHPVIRPHIVLTDEQRAIVDQLIAALDTKVFVAGLVMGVTGSGKTEIYMHVIERALKQGRNAIVLVPEIALTPQLVGRLAERFGAVVGIMHSGIESSLLAKVQRSILSGDIRIVIGVRSAVFAPLKDVGVIVVDEEHAQTYKQQERFKYNARDAAIMRGKLEGALVILGSATPSLESYYNAGIGKYRSFRLYNRVRKLPMPDIHTIDLRKEHPHRVGNEILTGPLVDALTRTLSAGKQAIVMLNKRGYSSSLICTDCGHAPTCPQCDIHLAYHKSSQRLVCHYCGHSAAPMTRCPVCGSVHIQPLGIGTQRLEEEIKGLFRDVGIVRMDSDTTARKGSHEKLIDLFGSGGALLLLGTQMVAKGLDFPNVELVCLPMLDVGLNVPDFRSAERIFDVITQSAGRAGRIASGAHVYLQTYNPEYYAIRYAVEYDIEAFYREELRYRKELLYPPFSRLALLMFRHKNIERLRDAMEGVVKGLSDIPEGVRVSGPVPAPIPKMKGLYVYHLLLRSQNTAKLLSTVHELDRRLRPAMRNVKMSIDIDPQYFV